MPPDTRVLFILTNIFNPHHNPMSQVLQIKLDIHITIGKQTTDTYSLSTELYPIFVITYIERSLNN